MTKPYAALHETFAPTSVAWSPDGKYIADMGMYDSIVHVWDVDKKKIVHTLPGGPSPYMHAIAWSPDGHFLAVRNGPNNAMVSVWDTTTWQQKAALPPPMERTGGSISPVFSPDGQYFAFADDAHGDVFVYSTATWQLTAQTGFQRLLQEKLLPGESHSTLTGEQISFEPNGYVIAIAVLGYFNDDNDNYTSRVIFWDIRQPPPNVDHPMPGQIVEVYGPGPLVSNPSYPNLPPSHSQACISTLTFRPDGLEFATGTAASSASIWDTKSTKLIASPLSETHQGRIDTLVYTADGQYLIASDGGAGSPQNLGGVHFINDENHKVVDSLSVDNYGGLGYSEARNAIAVGSHSLSGFKLFVWQIQNENN